MPFQITGERLTSLLRPRSVALVGASDNSPFSMLAYRNLVEFGFADCERRIAELADLAQAKPDVTA